MKLKVKLGETMNFSSLKILSIILFFMILFVCFNGCISQDKSSGNKRPVVKIINPSPMSTVLGVVNISGFANDPDNDSEIKYVEIKIENKTDWIKAEGKTEWIYTWKSFSFKNGSKKILVRAWDGNSYSTTKYVNVNLKNPQDMEYNNHRWALFIAAANFPENEMSKLGNGGLYLAQNMSNFFIDQYKYSTSNVHILFDDGWLRRNSGFGEPVRKLQKIPREYNYSYGPATKDNVVSTLQKIIRESNKYDDSEVFIWIFNHGFGDYTNEITGGKVFERSAIFLWDDYLVDSELGNILDSLRAQETCIVIDACYIGGFADRTILNLPTFPTLESGIPQQGRVVITSTSKFRTGIAIIEYGPLFSILWFEGLRNDIADGFRQGLFKSGRKPLIQLRDGLVSVEESFYYARYLLRTNENINEFKTMQPQINDKYPHNGFIRSLDGLILGDN